VKASYAALAGLLPARFGKTEQVVAYQPSLVLPVPAPVVTAPAELTTAAAPASAPPPAPPAPAAPQPSSRLVLQHERAVSQATAGQIADAELEFKQLLEAAPQFGGAAYNLGVLLRGQNRLEEAEAAFADAARRVPGSALPLTELGVTQRQRGKFVAAVESYEQALSADPGYAPALRNLGVVRDVYLGDPAAAVEPFERYKALTGEDRPVTSWIADVKQRAARRDAAPAAPAAQAEAL
jgi:lipoprotein NlpI